MCKMSRATHPASLLEFAKLISGALPRLSRLTSKSSPSDFLAQLTCRSGDGGKAHDLSQEGKSHQQRQDQLDDQASEWIYNGECAPYTAPCHGVR